MTKKQVQHMNDIIQMEFNAIEEAKKQIEAHRENIKTMTKGLYRCEHCSSYFPEVDEYKSHDTTERVETVYIDGGYGDDDELATVTRFNIYLHCPICQMRNQISSTKIGERDRHTRR